MHDKEKEEEEEEEGRRAQAKRTELSWQNKQEKKKPFWEQQMVMRFALLCSYSLFLVVVRHCWDGCCSLGAAAVAGISVLYYSQNKI